LIWEFSSSSLFYADYTCISCFCLLANLFCKGKEVKACWKYLYFVLIF
jgi:hypothetical protein